MQVSHLLPQHVAFGGLPRDAAHGALLVRLAFHEWLLQCDDAPSPIGWEEKVISQLYCRQRGDGPRLHMYNPAQSFCNMTAALSSAALLPYTQRPVTSGVLKGHLRCFGGNYRSSYPRATRPGRVQNSSLGRTLKEHNLDVLWLPGILYSV